MKLGKFQATFGLDPEVFAVKKGARLATSAHLFELEPYKTTDDGYGPIYTMLKKDGFAFEFNSDPTSCRDWLVPSLGATARSFYRRFPGYELSAIPKMRLNAESLKDAPADVVGYGCIPDRNAYTLQEKTPMEQGYKTNARFTGCHLHFALKDILDNHELLAAAATILADIRLGVPMVAMIGETNDYGEQARREYYGQAGSHRVTKFGFEYRVLSSAVMLSPGMLSWAIGQLRHVIGQKSYATNSTFPFFDGSARTQYGFGRAKVDKNMIVDYVKGLKDTYDFGRVENIINTHDVKDARAFIEQHNLTENMYLPSFFNMMLKADDKKVPLETKFYTAWALGDDIINHRYIGCERIMGGGVTTTAFPPFDANADYGVTDYLEYDDEDDYYDYDEEEEEEY